MSRKLWAIECARPNSDKTYFQGIQGAAVMPVIGEDGNEAGQKATVTDFYTNIFSSATIFGSQQAATEQLEFLKLYGTHASLDDVELAVCETSAG